MKKAVTETAFLVSDAFLFELPFQFSLQLQVDLVRGIQLVPVQALWLQVGVPAKHIPVGVTRHHGHFTPIW